MRVFKNKPFARFARKARITDAVLCAAIADASRGLVDADLGGGVVKQRIARQGGGKSGGFRTIILFQIEPGRIKPVRLRNPLERNTYTERHFATFNNPM